jgi:hypothetical protein
MAAVSRQDLVFAISIASQLGALVAYGIVRRRRQDDGSRPRRSLADKIVGATLLCAIALIAYTAVLTSSRDDPLVLRIWIGFAVVDSIVAFFLLDILPVTFVQSFAFSARRRTDLFDALPAILIVMTVINVLFLRQEGDPVFIFPCIAFSAFAIRSIRRTRRRGEDTKAT